MVISSAFDSRTSDFWRAGRFLLERFLSKPNGGSSWESVGAGLIAQEHSPSFEDDRPFIFLIRDVKRRAILFFGCVMEPDPERLMVGQN